MTVSAPPRAFVDVDETRADPVAHRYVHGGFNGTDTRFSVYFPPADVWRGRAFSSIEGGAGGRETRAAGGAPGPGSIAFAFAMGAYLVETNGGHIPPEHGPALRGSADPALTAYGASADCARHARELAAGIYGRAPHHGYVFGPSGGGWRTVLCMENVDDVWDGAVPFISGMGGGVNFPSLVANVARVLGPSLAGVIDAHDPGGSGDPFAALTGQQRLELARLYRAGLQPGAEHSMIHPELRSRLIAIVGGMHHDLDPGFVEDFWRLPGHAGADGELESDRIDLVATVARRLSDAELRALLTDPSDAVSAVTAGSARPLVGICLDAAVAAEPHGAVVRATSGAARGAEGVCVRRMRDVLVVEPASAEPLEAISIGDRVALDNRRHLAFCHLYRHQVDAEYEEARQLMVGGAPIYPQRAVSVADALTGVRLTGRFNGRMIYVANLKDTFTSPVSGAIGYRSRVRANGGPDAEARLRTWLIDNAQHIDGSRLPQGEPPVTATRLIDWGGCVERAIAALIAWVEEGTEPPDHTGYTYRDGRVDLEPSARSRLGIQPVVTLAVDDRRVTSVSPGAEVTLEATAEVPPNSGRIVAIEWDPEGRGAWIRGETPDDAATGPFRSAMVHSYDRRGTHFPAVRVTTHPGGGIEERFCRVTDLARARVIVR